MMKVDDKYKIVVKVKKVQNDQPKGPHQVLYSDVLKLDERQGFQNYTTNAKEKNYLRKYLMMTLRSMNEKIIESRANYRRYYKVFRANRKQKRKLKHSLKVLGLKHNRNGHLQKKRSPS